MEDEVKVKRRKDESINKFKTALKAEPDPSNKKGWKSLKLAKKLKSEKKLLKQLKRKRDSDSLTVTSDDDNHDQRGGSDNVSAHKEEDKRTSGRPYTVSIAVSGSIIDNAQTPQLKAYLAGQVARAAAIFNVDEVIVYDDTGGLGKVGCEQMARILQFLECPQYLRKGLFPIHPDLQYAGLIAPLDIPHHLRRHEALPYR